MSVVSEQQVQQWLEATKLTIDDVDDELESTAKSLVFSSLTSSYGDYVPFWLDIDTTPLLVQQVMSMLIAAWQYNRAYSEDNTSASSYGKWLEDKAMALLAAIDNGTMSLPEIGETVQTSTTPSFYPKDDSFDLATNTPVVAAFGMNARF